MAWLDDRIRDHPKIIALSKEAFWFWAMALTYCSEHGTQGHLDAAIVALRVPRRITAEITSVGLWEHEPDGLWVHDWQEYNGKRDDALEERRAADRERQRKHREKVRQARSGHVTPPTESRDTHPPESRDSHVTDSRGGAPARARAPAGPRPNVKTTTTSRTSAADVDHLLAAADAAAAEHRDRLRFAGWTDAQLAFDDLDLPRAIALLDEAEADLTCRAPGALAWTKFSNGSQPQASRARTTPTPSHRCEHCPAAFSSWHELDEHERNEHLGPVTPPPPDLARQLLRGIDPDDDPEPGPPSGVGGSDAPKESSDREEAA